MTSAATAAPRRPAADPETGTRNAEPGTRNSVAPLTTDYFDRLLPAPPVICGRQLLPLSIGRYRLLRRFRCAFVADGPVEANAGDLLIGVLVCSNRVDDFIAFVGAPNFKSELNRWARIFGFLPPPWTRWPVIGWLWQRWFGEACDRVDVEKILAAIDQFQDYIAENQHVPPHWEESQPGRPSAAHWSHSIETALREYQGWTREEINEEPLSKALWDYFKHCENHGLIRLMTPDELAEVERQETPEELAAWQEYARKVELAKAGIDPNSERGTQNAELRTEN